MPFRDIPPVSPYLRYFFSDSIVKQFIFSSHGIWNPKSDGMTRVQYTYHWYTQPTETLDYSTYLQKLKVMGSAEPVDIFGPRSGQVANMRLVPLEQYLFSLTVKGFQNQTKLSNPNGLALLAFHGSAAVKAMSLDLLDKQLLPALKYPLANPVHMVVCRSMDMKQTVPVVKHNVQVIAPLITPFDSITNDML